MEWTIPRLGHEALKISLQPGDRLFVVGANGSGKSALLQNLVSSNRNEKIRRITAHRQTWLQSGNISMTPQHRKEFHINIESLEKGYNARWIDYHAKEKLSAVFFDLVSKNNARARSIQRLVDDNNTEEASIVASRSAPPFDQLNELLKLAMLGISLENDKDEEIRARHWSSDATFSVAQMSDGERNAAIIAATVLTVEEESILLIDEPERHLHRSIIEPFLSALFAQRKDCTFIVSTHEIALPGANPEARVLMLRSCQWSEDAVPITWDFEILETDANLPEDLKRAILGARRRVLFVEGNSNSLDLPLYNALFPDLSVISMGSCGEIMKAVKGLRQTRAHHHTEAFGLIDKDDRTEDEIVKLAKENIFAMSVYSAEAFYYCHDAIVCVAKRQAELYGSGPNGMASLAKKGAFAAIESDTCLAKRMAARRCERRTREKILSCLPNWKQFMNGTDSQIDPPDFSSLYSEELSRFRGLVSAGKLDDLIALYPLRESCVFDKIAKSLKFSSRRDYEQVVLAQVRNDAELAKKLKQRIGSLCCALEGERQIL